MTNEKSYDQLSVNYSDLVSDPQNFVVPTARSIATAEEILERSPRVLSCLEEVILEIETDIGFRKGKIVLANKEEKAAVLKAITETDDEYLILREKERKIKAVFVLWTNSYASAKYKLSSMR